MTINVGGSLEPLLNVTLPSNPSLCGDVHGLLVLDPSNTIDESDKSNNVAAGRVTLSCDNAGIVISLQIYDLTRQ